MREHGDLLREIVREDLAEATDLTPGGDPNIRAHLRFVATALHATLAPPLGDALEGFADELPEWFDESLPLFDAHLETGVGAIALEEHLQFGTSPGSDPSLDAGLERRVADRRLDPDLPARAWRRTSGRRPTAWATRCWRTSARASASSRG